MTIPANSLPASGSITVQATMVLGGVSAAVSLTVPLNRRPRCTAAAGACLSLRILNNTFPSEVVVAGAVGFSDAEDASLA